MVAVKTLIFTVLVPGTVTVLIPYLLLSSDVQQRFPVKFGVVRFFGPVPMLMGILIYL
jgi:hypothetical protein